MHHRRASERRTLLDADMTRQQCVVNERDAVREPTIVGHMAASQQVAVLAHLGYRFRLGAATFTATEGQAFVTIPVERVGGFEGDAHVRLRTTDGSAVAGTDYQARDFQLDFSAGDMAENSSS